jgi:hypothetical protein
MRFLKVAGGAVAGLAVLAVIAAVWINSVASRKRAEMDVKLKDLVREITSRDMNRPPRGELLKGNAWDDYEKAFVELKADKDGMNAIQLFAWQNPKADPAKAAAAVAAHLGALDLLRQGNRRENGVYPSRWEDGASMQVPSLLSCQHLGNLVVARARLLREEGKPREAVEQLLDACHFARDIGYNSVLISEMISLAVYGMAFEELAVVLATGKLSREDLLALDQALDGVERRFPKMGHSLLNEAAALGYSALNGGDFLVLDGGPPVIFRMWRFGFSERIMASSAYDEIAPLLRKTAGIDAMSWAEVQKLEQDVRAEVDRSRNPIVTITIPGLTTSERASRERRTQLRLLRAVARWRATGSAPDGEDPFGAKLLHAETDGKLKVWSAGRDGKDDGGDGKFHPGTAVKDIVLEAGR